MSDTSKTFIGRWSQRKIKAREAEAAELAAKDAAEAAATAAAVAAANEAEARNALEYRELSASAAESITTGSPSLGVLGADSAAQAPVGADAAPTSSTAPPKAPGSPALPSLADVAELTSESDYSVFMAKGVAPEVKNAAMKKLFSDPHYNIMDGLDIYIDDYSSPEIMPASMLRKMASARVLNLFTDEDEAKAVAADLAAAEAEATATAANTPAVPHTESPSSDVLAPDAIPEALPGTVTAMPVSNREATSSDATDATDASDRRHDATARPRATADVLASAPRPDASRTDGDHPVLSRAPSSISSPSGDS